MFGRNRRKIRKMEIDITGAPLAATMHLKQALEMIYGEIVELEACAITITDNGITGGGQLPTLSCKEAVIKGLGRVYPSNDHFRADATFHFGKKLNNQTHTRWRVLAFGEIRITPGYDKAGAKKTKRYNARWLYSDGLFPKVKVLRMPEVGENIPPPTLPSDLNMWQVGHDLRDRHQESAY